VSGGAIVGAHGLNFGEVNLASTGFMMQSPSALPPINMGASMQGSGDLNAANL
jgi:hypothetical protein